MPRKDIPAPKKSIPASKSTPARNTPLPKPQAIKTAPAPISAPAPRIVTYEMIAKRAYEISLSGKYDQMGNWLAAERELKGIK